MVVILIASVGLGCDLEVVSFIAEVVGASASDFFVIILDLNWVYNPCTYCMVTTFDPLDILHICGLLVFMSRTVVGCD